MSPAETDHARALAIARETMAHPAHLTLVQEVVEAINRAPRLSTDILASHLAYAYARGLIKGWRAREAHRGDSVVFVPPEPN